MIIAAAPLLPEALPRGVPPTQIDVSSAKDALMRAVVTCDEDAALAAIAAGAGFGRKERETGYTALHHACQFGLQRLVEVLLDEGADLTAKTRDLILQGAVIQPGGQTALHLAAMHGEAAIVDLLLARGADVDSEDFDGLTPAVTAAVQKRRAIADRLAAVAGTTLPSAEALETISNCSREAGRVRAAGQLSVPPHLRQVYTLERVWSIEECERVLAEVQAAAAEAATRTAIAGTLGLSNGDASHSAVNRTACLWQTGSLAQCRTHLPTMMPTAHGASDGTARQTLLRQYRDGSRKSAARCPRHNKS